MELKCPFLSTKFQSMGFFLSCTLKPLHTASLNSRIVSFLFLLIPQDLNSSYSISIKCLSTYCLFEFSTHKLCHQFLSDVHSRLLLKLSLSLLSTQIEKHDMRIQATINYVITSTVKQI